LIVALNRKHLERILDARFGLVPTLATVDDTRGARLNPHRQTAVFVVQGELAADVLDRWLANAAADGDSLLAPAWWDRVVAAEIDQRLGLVLDDDGKAGMAVVLGVHPNAPSGAGLRTGDRIVAVDGAVLDLGRPAADLRQRWLEAPADRSVVLRVLRGDEASEVAVAPLRAEDRGFATQIQPVQALRELAAVLRAVPFATFVAYATDERHYSARVTLRLASPAQAE
jgi:predicted metalloprotease with PDZ domain